MAGALSLIISDRSASDGGADIGRTGRTRQCHATISVSLFGSRSNQR